MWQRARRASASRGTADPAIAARPARTSVRPAPRRARRDRGRPGATPRSSPSRRVRADALVFCTVTGRPQGQRNALRAIQTAATNANLGHVTAHDLRHSLVANALDAGLTLPEKPRGWHGTRRRPSPRRSTPMCSSRSGTRSERNLLSPDSARDGLRVGLRELPRSVEDFGAGLVQADGVVPPFGDREAVRPPSPQPPKLTVTEPSAFAVAVRLLTCWRCGRWGRNSRRRCRPRSTRKRPPALADGEHSRPRAGVGRRCRSRPLDLEGRPSRRRWRSGEGWVRPPPFCRTRVRPLHYTAPFQERVSGRVRSWVLVGHHEWLRGSGRDRELVLQCVVCRDVRRIGGIDEDPRGDGDLWRVELFDVIACSPASWNTWLM